MAFVLNGTGISVMIMSLNICRVLIVSVLGMNTIVFVLGMNTKAYKALIEFDVLFSCLLGMH